MRKLYLLGTLVLTVFFSNLSFAQDFSNKGKNFWISYPQHIDGTASLMGLYITSDVNTTGVITINGLNIPFSIVANSITPRFLTQTGTGANVIGLNTYVHLQGISDGIKQRAAIHVTSVKPVVVYAHIIRNARSGASLILPTNVWGKEYFVPSYANTGGGSAAQGVAEINIMAALPNTVVEITPTIATASRPAGVPFQITLVAPGDVYQLQFPKDTDPSGTKVRSIASSGIGCQPIAVVSATTWTAMNCASGNGGDNFYQQLFPSGAWGKNFITTPLKRIVTSGTDKNVDIIRVYVKDITTVVTVMDDAVTTTLTGLSTPGNFYEYAAFEPTSIKADKPVQVMQYVKTQECSSPNTQSDPEMIALSSVEQTINDITVYSAFANFVPNNNSDINTHWLNVTMKTANIGTFRINGAIPSAPFNVIPGTAYSFLKQSMNTVFSGVSRLTADSGFNAIAYGFGQYESYGYNAGTNVKDLYQQIGVATQFGIEPTPAVCKSSPFRFKVSLPYCADSIRWDLSQLPGPPPVPPTSIYTTCAPGPNGPDSTTIVNGVTLYWYSLPTLYNLGTSGTFPVSILVYKTTPDDCGNEQEIPFDLSVYEPPVADFTHVDGGCVAESYEFYDNTVTPRPSYIWNWDFGDPASGLLNTSDAQNPTHIFSGPGTYNVKFSTITTPGCISAEIIKQVVVKALPTGSISGSATVCINAPGPTITFTGAEGKVPYTFTYNIDNGSGPGPNQTISTTGTNTSVTLQAPTNVAGTFRYNLVGIQNTGSTICTQNIINSFVDVIVTPDAAINLTSAPATTNQTLCINTPITNITYAITGSGTGGNVVFTPALPGVTGAYAAGVVTITGTPTASGTFNYTVTPTSPCVVSPLSGTIHVTADATINLASAPGTDNQTVCINNLITQIRYQVSGSGTGGNVVFTPALPGVTGSYSGGFVTIIGTPTISGTFNYTVTPTGPCVNPPATGTITVTGDATINLTSAAGTNIQTVCVNHAITPVTYGIGGTATGGTVVFTPALPGVTGTYSGGVLTMTGTPTASGTFNYIARAVGPCAQPQLAGTITVNQESTLTLNSLPATENQELCVNSTLTPIRYLVGGSGTGGTVVFTPALPGVTGSFSGGFITINGAPTLAGTYTYTVSASGPCVETGDGGTIIVNALPTANFSVTTPACETRVLTFSDLSVPNSGALNAWTWNFGDGSPAEHTPGVTHIYPTAGGPFTVTLSVTTDKGCTSNPIASQSITINARPVTDFTVPEVCVNDVAAVFTDASTVAGGFDPTGYHWDFGDPGSGLLNTSTTMNGTHHYTSVGLYTVRHISTSALGCKDTVYHDIFINGSDPVSDFNITNLPALCSNDTVSLVNRSTIAQGSVTKLEIYWDFIGAPGTFETINVPVFNNVHKHKYPTSQTPQNYTVRVIAYSGATCLSVKTTAITVNATPKVQFNTMPDVCLDAAPFQITQASEIGGVPGTGVFSGPGVSASGIFSPASVGPGTYLIKYTYSSTAAGCMDTLSKPITVLDSASARFTYSALACERSAVAFDASSSTIPAGAGSITGYTWDFGDPASGAANTSSLLTPSHTFTHWGSYTVTLYVTTSNSCRSTLRTQQVFVNPIARPDFSVPLSACLPSANVTFNNLSTIPDGTQASFSYSWNFGDPPSGILNTSSGSSPSHIYNTLGPFNVNLQVTSGAGCVHDTTIVLNTLHPEPAGSFTVNKNDVCIGQSITFNNTSDPADGTTQSYSWALGDGNTRSVPSFTYTYGTPAPFNVTLFITNSHGCRSSLATKTVTVNAYPIVDAGPDLFILQGGRDTLEPIVTATNPSFLWSPNMYFNGSNTIKNAIVNGVEDITYTLTVIGQGDCPSSDQVFIKVLKGPEIPNIFSPNGDGIHDKWEIKYLDTYPDGTVEIFNRYGQLIFKSTGYSKPWDGTVGGKAVPVGTYYYIVNPKNGRNIMSGYVDVIR